MRISDWSSDVCSSDLLTDLLLLPAQVLSDGRRHRYPALRRGEPEGRDGAGGDRHAADEGCCRLSGTEEENNSGRPSTVGGAGNVRGTGKAMTALHSSIDPRDAGFIARQADRQSVVSGKSVSVRVDLGGRRIIKKKINNIKN